MSLVLPLIMGRPFIFRRIDSRGELREFFDPFHQGFTDGAEPFDLLLLFANHIIQVFDALFLKCDFSFNFHQTFFTHFYVFPPASWPKNNIAYVYIKMPPSLYPSPSTGEGGVGVIFILRCATLALGLEYSAIRVFLQARLCACRLFRGYGLVRLQFPSGIRTASGDG